LLLNGLASLSGLRVAVQPRRTRRSGTAL
jgi:hypothetical protein